MRELVWRGQVGGGWGGLATDIRFMDVVDTPDGPVIMTATGPAGGMVTFRPDPWGAQRIDSVHFSPALAPSLTGFDTGAVIDHAGEAIALLTGSAGEGIIGYGLDAAGEITARAVLDLPVDGAPVLAAGADGRVYAVTGPGIVQVFTPDADGGFAPAGTVRDTADTHLADPVALATVQVGGSEFLLALCGAETGLTAYRIDPAGGGLTPVAALGVDTGLGLLRNLTALEIVQAGGTTYVLVGSAADGGTGGALSVFTLAGDGTLQLTDHVLDNRLTRFGTVDSVEVAQVDGWTYVLAGGGDSGLSLFVLMPNGRLHHLDTVVDSLASGLETISALSMVREGDLLHIYAASGQTTGLAHLVVDLSGQGVVREAVSGRIDGGAGDDLLVGGRGAGALYGHGGDDILVDGRGRDTLWGGAGADSFVLDPDGETDVIADFSPGEDRLDLSAVPMLYGAAQLRVAERAWGAVLVFPDGEETEIRSATGGTLTAAEIFAAIDWAVDRPPLVLFNELAGSAAHDTLVGSAGIDVIRGDGGNDLLRGGGGADRLEGGAGFDTIYGGAGDDEIYAGNGRDSVMGGDGHDLIVDTPQGGWLGQDTIWAGAGNDTVSSGGGWDVVYGEAGDDWIYAGWGFDSVWGGAGNDTLIGAGGFDDLDGGAGDDRLEGGAGNDRLFGGIGHDLLLGGSNADRLFGQDGDDTLEGQHGYDLLDGGAGDDWMHGGSHDDTLLGGAGHDTLIGAFGHDRLEGQDGGDVLDGGHGHDWMHGGAGADRLLGGAMNDTLLGGFGNDTLEGQHGHDVIDGGYGDDWIHGGAMNDTIRGGAGHDTINGGSGRDLVDMGAGDDLFVGFFQHGWLGRDTIRGGDGDDTILASAGDDLLYGDGGHDSLFGGLGNDVLDGGAGRDTLQGAGGDDILTGGAEADVFVFTAGSGVDVITDFEPGLDRLELSVPATAFADLTVVDAPRGVWLEWSGGALLLEGLGSSDITASDVLFV